MLHNHHAVYPPIPITDIPGDDDVIILTMWSPSRSHWVPASKNLLLLHLYSLTRSEMIKSTEHNWWKFSRAMRYIITDISSCYHHPHSPAIRASSLLHLLSCQFFLLVLPNWLIIMNHGCSHPSVIQWRYRKVQHYLVLFFPISIMSIMALLAAARFLNIFHQIEGFGFSQYPKQCYEELT